MTSPLETLAAGLEKPGQPETLYRMLEEQTQSLVGHKLFTLLYVDESEVARVYSSNPVAYPVFGRKPMGPTPWGKLLMEARQPYIGTDAASIRWAFFDHELIASLGLGSVINIPVVYDGETIGTMNLLDAEHHYMPAHVPLIAALAPSLIPAFLLARSKT
jgi:hypothetical protein